MTITYEPTAGIAKAPEAAEFHYTGRWIWPNDIVWDRQEVVGDDGCEGRQEFIHWLQRGDDRGNALIHAANRALKLAGGYAETHVDSLTGDTIRTWISMPHNDTKQHILYEDDYGILVGWPRGGYVYVVGWRKQDMLANNNTPKEG